MADEEGMTLQKLRDAAKLIGASGFVAPPLYSRLMELPKIDRAEMLFGSPLGSYLGIRFFKAPAQLFRQPDKPLRSRPRRKWVRANRKAMKAERAKLRRGYRVSSNLWKSRKVPDRRGYSQNTMFLLNPNALA
jgi:hypothetical protein